MIITFRCRQIKRITKKLNLSRRRESNMEQIIEAVRKELENGSRNFGIRCMQTVLTVKYHLVVRR